VTFEFTYDDEAEEITIIYDNSTILKASSEDGDASFRHFSKIDDEDVEHILKNLCKQVLKLYA